MSKKIGRNDPCPCGSGKKYKHCCLKAQENAINQAKEEILNVLNNQAFDNLEELTSFLKTHTDNSNNRPKASMCGISPNQMHEWIYGDYDKVAKKYIRRPKNLSQCPVMTYLDVIFNAIANENGTLKATAQGNLPLTVVSAATATTKAMTIMQDGTVPQEFKGRSEQKFLMLNYTRTLAQLAGLVSLQNNRFVMSDSVLSDYREHGVTVFFDAMMKAALSQYTWHANGAGRSDEDHLGLFWVFLLWRLFEHGKLYQLTQEFMTAFPDYLTRTDLTADGVVADITRNFRDHFLMGWGLVWPCSQIVAAGAAPVAGIIKRDLFNDMFNFSKL